MASTGLRRICLVTPGHLATNPRIVKEADALSEAGYDVTVVAANYLRWGAQADTDFAERGWRLAAKVSFGPMAPKRDYFVQTLRRKVARGLLRVAARLFGATKFDATRRWLSEYAVHPATAALTKAVGAIPADLYVAHYIAALPAAAKAARRHNAKFSFDAEDFHSGEFPETNSAKFDRDLVRTIEKAYLPQCAYLTAASPGIADAYAKAYGLAPPTVLLNVFPRANAPDAPSLAGTVTPGPSVYWFSQTIGPNRGLETAVKALAQSVSRPHLHLRGAPVAGFAESLVALARENGVADHLHFHEPAPPAEMERIASAYDIGIVSETGHTQNRSIALTNKLFSYLLAGIPVVASAIPAHRALPELESAVFLYEQKNAAELARLLDELLLDRQKLCECRAAAWRLGQNSYNWDVEKKLLISVVSKAMGSPTRNVRQEEGAT